MSLTSVYLCSVRVRVRIRVGVGVRVRVRARARARARVSPPVLTVTLSRLAHLLHGLQLRERGDGGRADLDRAARLPAIRQPGVPVVVEVVNRVEAGEAPRHAPHRTWASALGVGRWRWAWVAGAAPGGALGLGGACQSGGPQGQSGGCNRLRHTHPKKTRPPLRRGCR